MFNCRQLHPQVYVAIYYKWGGSNQAIWLVLSQKEPCLRMHLYRSVSLSTELCSSSFPPKIHLPPSVPPEHGCFFYCLLKKAFLINFDVLHFVSFNTEASSYKPKLPSPMRPITWWGSLNKVDFVNTQLIFDAGNKIHTSSVRQRTFLNEATLQTGKRKSCYRLFCYSPFYFLVYFNNLFSLLQSTWC